MNILLRQLSHFVLSIFSIFALNACSEDVELPDNNEPEYDVMISVKNISSNAWQVSAATDKNGDDVTNVAEALNSNNTSLNLTLDKRYYIKNPAGGVHPFEFVAGSDILLSQFAATDATFENDADVDFATTEDGFIFTFTQALSDVITGYQCAFHPGPMSGLINTEAPNPNEPDVIITMISDGSSAWHVDTVVGATGIAAIHTDNPNITLTTGLRYEFRINAPGHPFQLIDASNASLISGVSGSFHDDTEVNYIKSGNNFTFTLTDALAAELVKYRCGIHTGSMVGNIVIE